MSNNKTASQENKKEHKKIPLNSNDLKRLYYDMQGMEEIKLEEITKALQEA